MMTRSGWIAKTLVVALPMWACAVALGEDPKPAAKPAAPAAAHGEKPAAAPAPAKPATPAAAPAATATASAGAQATVGKPAPDFTGKDINGKDVKLSSFKGKVVVLEWTNHDCPVVNNCYGKSKAIPNTMAKFKGQDVVWISINSSNYAQDKLADIKKWVADNKVENTYVIDAPGTIGKMFGAKTTPHMFVIDKAGVLAYAGAIDNNPDGKNKDVRNYVEEAVSSLMKGSSVATPTTDPYGCTVKYKG